MCILGLARLFFFLDIQLPAQLGIQPYAKEFRGLGVRYGFAIHNDRYKMKTFVGEGHVGRLVFMFAPCINDK